MNPFRANRLFLLKSDPSKYIDEIITKSLNDQGHH